MSGSIYHVDLTVTEIGRSTGFYDRVLPLMGFRRSADFEETPIWAGEHLEIGVVPAQTSSIRGHDRCSPGLHHLAFQRMPVSSDMPSRKLRRTFQQMSQSA